MLFNMVSEVWRFVVKRQVVFAFDQDKVVRLVIVGITVDMMNVKAFVQLRF